MATGKSVIAGLAAVSVTAAVGAATMLTAIFGLRSKYVSKADAVLVEFHLHFWPVLWALTLAFVAGVVWNLIRTRHAGK